MGNQKESNIELLINNERTDDPNTLVECFSDFFLSKAQSLSTSPISTISLRLPINPLMITESELELALKSLSNKKSFGVDDILQNVLFDSLPVMSRTVADALNSFARHGLPKTLKVARVIPLHKKGNKLEVANYRPISNLSIFSKIY